MEKQRSERKAEMERGGRRELRIVKGKEKGGGGGGVKCIFVLVDIMK